MSFWNQYGFPDPATEMAGRLYIYHDFAMVVVVMVMLVVGWFLLISLLGQFFYDGSISLYIFKNEPLETFWTVVPSLFLAPLCYVSLVNLSYMEVGDNVTHSIQVIGHQWYWEYQYVLSFNKGLFKSEHELLFSKLMESFDLSFVLSLENLGCDSNMSHNNSFFNLIDDLFRINSENYTPEEVSLGGFESGIYMSDESVILEDISSALLDLDMLNANNSVLLLGSDLLLKGDWYLKEDSYSVPEEELVDMGSKYFGGFRNQSASCDCLLACGVKNEVLVSSADVMHSWGVSELGVKADAVPGRVNALSVTPLKVGLSFGNCYELCGENHSQMPINVLSLDYSTMIKLLKDVVLNSEEVVSVFNES